MTIHRLVFVYLKGLAMGAADIVPGVSGGTIAFITGIYDELLSTIKAFNLNALKILFSKGLKACWQAVNANFLLALVLGIGTAFLLFANLITGAINTYPLLVWSFFLGLVVASVFLLYQSIPHKRASVFIFMLLGAVIAYLATTQTQFHLSPTPLNFVLAGAIAICAMILPGVSGSFLLLMMGMYFPLLQAIRGFDWLSVVCFIGGAVTGLMLFVRVLTWFLQKFRAATLALLTGFLLGSLHVLWPWKQVLSYRESSSGPRPLLQENILPMQYTEVTGLDAMLAGCVLMAIAGMLVIAGVEYISKTRQ